MYWPLAQGKNWQIRRTKCKVLLHWRIKARPQEIWNILLGWWFEIIRLMFISTWGNDPNLTNMFQLGWNQQLVWNASESATTRQEVIYTSTCVAIAFCQTDQQAEQDWAILTMRLCAKTSKDDFHTNEIQFMDRHAKPIADGFKHFLFSPLIWGRFPFWLIFFKRVETTN